MYEENKEARGMTYTGLETYVQQAAFDQTLTRLYGAEDPYRSLYFSLCY